MVRLNMAQNLKDATNMVRDGHVRVGPETVTDPAYFVTRSMEDFVTWVQSSAYKRKIMKYNDKVRLGVDIVLVMTSLRWPCWHG
jgi:U3 small nucleolar ribonucleoprotein protein IMP3